MKRFSAIVFVACCCLWPLPASAQDNQFTVMGVGNQSCGAWTRARQSKGAASFGLEQWLLGYASGISDWFSVEQHVDTLEAPDAQALFAWVDNYCRTNPLDTVQRAAAKLMIELRDRARKQRPATGSKNR